MNCLKRKVVCKLFDRAGNLISEGVNQCDPEGGKCARIGIKEGKENYSGIGCNSTHAEEIAIQKLDGKIPYKAILTGHDFYCDPCEQKLREKGVKEFAVINNC